MGDTFVRVYHSVRTDPSMAAIYDDHRAFGLWCKALLNDQRRFRIGRGDWARILAAFGGRCAYCGTDGPMQQDHRMPVSRGGATVPENIVPACPACNNRKSAAHPDDWPIREGATIRG
jgi:5-methylcytosine-specific restriction endonuclease McrA